MTYRPILIKLAFILLALLALAGCDLRPAARNTTGLEKQYAEATVAAIFVQTEMARPTRTETPAPPTSTPENTATPAPPVIRATAKPGLELYSHPQIPEYVFQIDNTRWQPDPSGETKNLIHKNITGCRVEPFLGGILTRPSRLLWQDLGRFRWEIMDYGDYALAIPVAGNGINGSISTYLQLDGYNQTNCRSEHLRILSNVMTRSEAQGEIAFAAFASPTPRSPLPDISCTNTPASRIRAGDYLAVTADALWMRSEPRADDSTKTRKFARYAPYMIRVTGSPVCEKYLYWPVEIIEIGQTSPSGQGWLAEGDSNEYYIVPVK